MAEVRRDGSSPLGRKFAEILNSARADLLSDFRSFGVTDAIVPSPEIHADLLTGMLLTIVEGILDRRITDRAKAVDSLVLLATAILAVPKETRELLIKREAVEEAAAPLDSEPLAD